MTILGHACVRASVFFLFSLPPFLLYTLLGTFLCVEGPSVDRSASLFKENVHTVELVQSRTGERTKSHVLHRITEGTGGCLAQLWKRFHKDMLLFSR